ncbi:MAG: hypothetical protein U5K75_06255, partial [Ahrensia sp.]|nr:hypothetical protein [Ahrensia sp.]
MLRSVIDGLVGSIDVLIASVGVAVVGFGVRYVGAMALSVAATANLSRSLIVLRGALLKTGIGVLIVGAGYLVTKFVELIQKAGGFGEVMVLMGGVAKGVWEKISAGASYMKASLALVFNDIEYAWLTIMQNMQAAFGRLLDSIASTSIGGLLGIEGGFEDRALQQSGIAIGSSVAIRN